MGQPKRKLFFLHVQKTGGAALTGAIANRFAERDCLLLYYSPEPELGDLDSLRYVSGHVPLSFVDRFSERPFVFTFLRDPVERALSAYSFIRTRPPEFVDQLLLFGRGPDAYERARRCLRLARELSIEEMIDRAPEIATEYFGNRQARALGSTSPEGGDERLELALAGLERCDFVGISERLDESASWLVGRLGWRPLTPIPRVNVTGERLRRDEVSPAGIDAIRALTAVDRELYRHAVERYERRLAEWKAAGGPRDETVEIEDAEPVSDLRFDQPIRGTGWLGRERQNGGASFCWIGESKRASVELAFDRDADSVVVEVAHAIDQSILESLRISVDGAVLRPVLTEGEGVVNAVAPLPRRRFRRRPPNATLTLEVDRALRPCDVDRSSPDDRRLSVAVRRAALTAATE